MKDDNIIRGSYIEDMIMLELALSEENSKHKSMLER